MKQKCHFCKKKLSTIESSFTCHCKFHFCMKHMNKHSHNCEFNSKLLSTKLLIDNNPKLIINKLN